ncbi:MAG: four helix bundle protein [Armatimonadota bacterium]|nr:four helix bundle protein [Armatimonadota bacterium]
MSDKLSEVKLYQLAAAAQQNTEAACAQFSPFEGLALSIQIKKSAKAAVAHIAEGFGRHNSGDRISLLRLAEESANNVIKGFDASLKSKLIKKLDCEKLKEEWNAAITEINEYITYLESGGEMESPLPGA